jgi:hypothetical protein
MCRRDDATRWKFGNEFHHDLKYDFTLLRRNAIEPPSVCFDTLLAARDCYGDLEFFNLPFLAQKLLGRKIKAYKDIVPKEKTFLELPFEEMKEHACTDADVALHAGNARQQRGGVAAEDDAVKEAHGVDRDIDAGSSQVALLDQIMNPDGDLLVGDQVWRPMEVSRQIGDVSGVGLLSAFGPATNGQTPDVFFS